MNKLACNNCNKIFASRSSRNYHVKNKVCEKNPNIRCKYCFKTFAHKNSMYRHIRETCKKNKKQNNTCDEKQNALDEMLQEMTTKLSEFDEMKDRIKKLEKENEKLKLPLSLSYDRTTINNSMVNIHNGDNINLVVNVVPFGKEDMSKISKCDLLKVFKSGFNSTLQLTEATHFNPKYPEYHNVYISNLKNKYAMIYDGDDWEVVMKNDLIDQLYDNKRNYIEDNLNVFLESLTISQRNALDRWMSAEDDHPYIKTIKNNIKLLLFNKRNLPKAIKDFTTENLEISNPCKSDVINVKNKKILKSSVKHKTNKNRRRAAPKNVKIRKNVVRRRKT